MKLAPGDRCIDEIISDVKEDSPLRGSGNEEEGKNFRFGG